MQGTLSICDVGQGQDILALHEIVLQKTEMKTKTSALKTI
jgi:hypothetical protein